jgi:hypothetical protein
MTMNQSDFISRYFKSPLILGDYLPDISIHTLNNGELRLYDLITNHLFLLCYSVECTSCLESMELLDQFLNQHPSRYNIAILIYCNEEMFDEVQQVFGERVSHIYRVTKHDLTKRMRVMELPSGFVVNRLGQVVETNNCLFMGAFHHIVEPLVKIV